MSNDSETPDTPASATILPDVVGSRLVDGLKLRLAIHRAPKRWQKPLQKLSREIEAGTALPEAIEANRQTLPGELQNILDAAIQLPDPMTYLAEVLQVREQVRRGWSRLASICLYPALLFAFALAVGISFSFSLRELVLLDEWVRDLGLKTMDYTGLVEDQHQALIGLGIICVWLILVMSTVYFVGPAWAWTSIVGATILFGKPLRWLCLQEILLRYRLALQQGVRTVIVADHVAASFQNGQQSRVTQAVAARIRHGMPFGYALSSSALSDGTCRPPLLMLDQRTDGMEQAIDDTAAILGSMVDERCQTLSNVLPMFILLFVGTIAWGALASYFLSIAPLLTVISSLA